MSCRDFLAGASLGDQNPETLLHSIRHRESDSPKSPTLAAGFFVVLESVSADPESRPLEVSILWHDIES
jgi:hypothetical protein